MLLLYLLFCPYLYGGFICSVRVTAGILTRGLTPLFIRSMRTGPRHWRARGHREITWSFTKVFFKFPKCFVSRLFQFFFLVLRNSNGCLWWYLWVDSASCMIKRFVVMFIATAIICRHSQPHLPNRYFPKINVGCPCKLPSRSSFPLHVLAFYSCWVLRC